MRLRIGFQVGGILTVAIHEPLLQPLFDPRKEVFHRNDFHYPLHLSAGCQPQPHVSDDAEQSIPPDGQGKQLLVFPPTARAQLPLSVHQDQGLDVADDRRETQPPSVNVGRKRTTQTNAVHARLLFADCPR